MPSEAGGLDLARTQAAWSSVRGRSLGKGAFVLNRATAILLTGYVGIHLTTISALALGERSWDQLMVLFRTKPFLSFDVALVAALLYHGLNGIRLVLLAADIGVRYQKALFWVLMLIGGAVLLYTAVRLLA